VVGEVVEVEFDAAALVLDSEFQSRHNRTTAQAAAPASDPAYDAVIAGLYPAMLEKGQLYYGAIKRVAGVTPQPWEQLSALQKLNAVSEATDVPVKAWLDASRPGAKPNLGALQLSVLAAGKKP
jgi:hypothetical protein